MPAFVVKSRNGRVPTLITPTRMPDDFLASFVLYLPTFLFHKVQIVMWFGVLQDLKARAPGALEVCKRCA